MIDVPVIRLELERMKSTMLTALDNRHEDMKSCLNAGIDAAMVELPMLIASRMKSAAVNAIDDAVTKAVTDYFTSGDGYEAIVRLVQQRISP